MGNSIAYLDRVNLLPFHRVTMSNGGANRGNNGKKFEIRMLNLGEKDSQDHTDQTITKSPHFYATSTNIRCFHRFLERNALWRAICAMGALDCLK